MEFYMTEKLLFRKKSVKKVDIIKIFGIIFKSEKRKERQHIKNSH